MENLAQISQLLMDAGQAHHQAFIATDGADPEWALWYAKYAQDKLNQLLGTSLPQAHIVYELIRLEKEMATSDASDHWTHYYAAALVEAYAGA